MSPATLHLVLILCSLNQATGEVYYITTNSTKLCTKPCLTLSQFSTNSSYYLHSNTTLVFLPGTHYLNTTNLTLSTVDYFVMKAENSTAQTQIKCANDSRIQFSLSQYVYITNLDFIECGNNQIILVEQFVVHNAIFQGQGKSETALELIKTTGKIVNSSFVSYTKGSYRKCLHYGVLIYYTYFGGCFSIGGAIIAKNSTIDITLSKFEDNRANFGGAIFAEQHSTLNMTWNVFVNNYALQGGALYSNNSTMTIRETTTFHTNSASVGGGVLFSYSSTIAIETSEFHVNNALLNGGVLTSYISNITIITCKFHKNSADQHGGVLSSYSSDISIKASDFFDNNATSLGGVLHSDSSTITIMEGSEFHANIANTAGVVHSHTSIITIQASNFHSNLATFVGGVLVTSSSTVIIEAGVFRGNNAINGGVLESYGSSNTTIQASEFHNNIASKHGGVLDSSGSSIIIGGCNFTNNSSPIGAVIYALDSSIQCRNQLLFENNSATKQGVIYLFNSKFIGYNTECLTFSNNLGSLVGFTSIITFTGYARFMNNQPPQTTIALSGDQEGGTITLLQSNASFDGMCNLEHNHAENGGAIHSTESKLYVNGNVTIAHNTATRNGGGVYLSNSELHCQQRSNFILLNNTAKHKGGGLHAISSSIEATSAMAYHYHIRQYTGTRVNFTKNLAQRGGGLSLEANAKLYILKYDGIQYYSTSYINTNTTIFTTNSADYGGAVYMDDYTNSGTCDSNSNTECFFQVLAIHGVELAYLQTQSIYFSHNHAHISGSTLYGGLLDRCAASQFAEVHKNYVNVFKARGSGIAYFRNISVPTYYDHHFILDTGATKLSVSSDPVRVCLCINNKYDCIHQSHIEVKKGELFTVSLVAIDQVGQPANATIQTSLKFAGSGLAEGQLARKIHAECTPLTFNVVSPHSSENLTLYALDGPCNDADLSIATIKINFLPCNCHIGLQVSRINSTNCTCKCHSDISQYVEQCDSSTGLLVKQPQSRIWISHTNITNLLGYLVYPNCPFDYCLSISPPLDLSQPNGADAQCAFNRSSLLCGSCQHDLSLSLGSSLCLLCPSYWPALLIAITITAFLAGIALVTLLLVLNMTVAVGTLNGLIFYANVVYANKSILLPFQRTNFVTVVISWLNLELGIDTCYFPRMDTYIKTWLQLAFPAYVILLVVLVIIISSYSTKFSNLIGKKDPVATLATLILLSYAKLLEICFKSLSVGILEYPDGSSENLWLPDATVKYLSGKHIPLFIAAVLILLVGLVYTILLFSWQWLLYLPAWRIFRWSRNPKIQTFVETYHTPYTPKHRYWTGLLLIIRIILYLVSAVNVSNDPAIALTAISFTVCCIFIFRQFVGSRMYRKWPVDVLETFSYFNLLSFAIFTWYSLDEPNSNQEAATYISITIAFIVLLLIILYHIYTYTKIFSKIKKTKLGEMIDRALTNTDPKPKPEHHYIPSTNDDIHQFLDMIHPVNTGDYKVPLKQQKPVKPTQTIVEVHQPQLASPDLEELTDVQHIPAGAAEVVQAGSNG